MRIFSELQRLVKCLDSRPGCWALCGGVVAAIYRETPRFTGDIDVAVVDSETETGGKTKAAREIAEEVLRELGYEPMLGFVQSSQDGANQTAALVCGRERSNSPFIGVDFLLPVFPWLPRAVERAQSNRIDYGFARVPTITIEDLVLAKLNAVQSPHPRAQDIDDLQSLLRSSVPIDYPYLKTEISRLGFPVPDWMRLLMA